MLREFKEFAMRGNVVDLAIGVIIGAAFNGIVKSIVGDMFMPVIGAVTGGLDFSNYFIASFEQGDRRHPCRSEEAGRRARLGQLPHRHDQLRHRRLGIVLGGEGDQSAEQAGSGEARCRAFAQEVLLTEIRDLLKQR